MEIMDGRIAKGTAAHSTRPVGPFRHSQKSTGRRAHSPANIEPMKLAGSVLERVRQSQRPGSFQQSFQGSFQGSHTRTIPHLAIKMLATASLGIVADGRLVGRYTSICVAGTETQTGSSGQMPDQC
jgi:hypothetical protein